jgi:hypothetical protein
MFRHAHPYPNVHVVRWQAFRAVRRVTVGAALILLGIASLLRSQGVITQQELWLVAPGAIALSGLVRLVACPSVGSAIGAFVRFAIAAYLVVVIEHIGGWTLAATWPVLLIAVGLGTVAHGLLGHRWQEEPNW